MCVIPQSAKAPLPIFVRIETYSNSTVSKPDAPLKAPPAI